MGDFYVCVYCGETCKGHHDCAMSRPVEYRPITYRPFDTVAVLPPKVPDPRDARIAELEAALAGLVDATKVHAEYHGPAAGHHRDDCPEDGTCSDCLFDRNICDHIEVAERALGRRK